MKLHEIMSRNPITVRPVDTLVHAEKLMLANGFRHLPVVESGQLVGLLSQRDIFHYQAQIGESIASNPTDKVECAMSSCPETAAPSDSVLLAITRMAEDKIGCIPILADGELAGIVTTSDVLRCQATKPRPAQLEYTVADIMTYNPQTVYTDDLLVDAAARMHSYKIRHLPVIDTANRVIGIISDRDVRTAFRDGKPAKNATIRVSHVMSRPVITTTPRQSCAEAARTLAKLSASAMPVVHNENGTLIGMLSYVDILAATS